jgi:hypothetical protein
LLYIANPGFEKIYLVLVGRYGGQNMESQEISKNSIERRDTLNLS